MTAAPTMLVTGSSGLIGSEVALHFIGLGWRVVGLDNNQRATFFGSAGDTRWNQARLEAVQGFSHVEADVRDRQTVLKLFADLRPQAIVHAAAQPSHDLAARIPFDDFDTNAVGTLNLLEASRRSCPTSPFVLMSTNKVYGDVPNEHEMVEFETRWDYADPALHAGINEHTRLDQCTHSLFGASKVAADVMCQEYGRYFDMPTVALRGGCLTGPHHSSVELHGFLNFLIKCNVEGRTYNVFGYEGKQVRDNIHSLDVARFIGRYIAAPRPGEVYNIGGARQNSISILEAFQRAAAVTGKPSKYEYVSENRVGDHICYITDVAKATAHYPGWTVTKDLDDIFEEIAKGLQGRR